MPHHPQRILLVALTAALMLAVTTGPAMSGDKKSNPPTKPGPAAKAAPTDIALAQELHAINMSLATANPVYKGHRAKAMHLIHKAVQALENHAKVKNKVKKPGENKKTTLTQVQSDALLVQAVKGLGVVQAQLATVANSPPHANATQDVRLAITELETALTIK